MTNEKIIVSRELLRQVVDDLMAIHPGNMTPMAEEVWLKSTRALIAALEQPAVEPVVGYELRHAIKQGERNAAEDAYFEARPAQDNPTFRRLFCAGFDRGYDAAPQAQQPGSKAAK